VSAKEKEKTNEPGESANPGAREPSRAKIALGAALRLLRRGKRRAGDALEAGSLAAEAWIAPKAAVVKEMLIGGAVLCAVFLGAFGPGREATPPKEIAARSGWATQEWVLAPASEIDSYLTLIGHEQEEPAGEFTFTPGEPMGDSALIAQDPSAINQMIKEAQAAAAARGDANGWRLPYTREIRGDLLFEQGYLDADAVASKAPIRVVETREAWEMGSARRDDWLGWAKRYANAPSWVGQAARERLAEPREPISLGLAGALALADGGDGSPVAAFEAASAQAKRLGFAATLPGEAQDLGLGMEDAAKMGAEEIVALTIMSAPGDEELQKQIIKANGGTLVGDGLTVGRAMGGAAYWRGDRLIAVGAQPTQSQWEGYIQIERGEAAKKKDDEGFGQSAARWSGSLFGGAARVVAAGAAAALLAWQATRVAGTAFSWASGGARLARWGAWRALCVWGARALAMGAAGLAVVLAGAVFGRVAGDLDACEAGGCAAFESALRAAGETGSAEKAGWVWAIEADQLVARARELASGGLLGEPKESARDEKRIAASAEQERLASQTRVFWSFAASGCALGLAMSLLGAIRKRKAKNAPKSILPGLPAAAPSPRIGDPEWQKEQIRIARARAEAKELAASLGQRENVATPSAATAGVAASGAAAPAEEKKRAMPRRL
jgi:hypothetical protein